MQLDILSLAILEMCRKHRGSNFCPSEVVRWVYPQDWKHFMDDVRSSMMDLYREGKIVVTQRGMPVKLDEMPKGPVRIQGIYET